MRRSTPLPISTIVLAIALSLPSGASYAAERVVLLEVFTNTS